MIEKAITKINDEIQKAPNDPYRATIGEYVIDHILTEDDAAKVLDERKTLERALQCVLFKAEREAKQLTKQEKQAREQEEIKKSGYSQKAVIASTTVFGWVMEYFGLEGEDSPNPQTAAEKPKEKPLGKGIVVSLDDFF